MAASWARPDNPDCVNLILFGWFLGARGSLSQP